MVKEKEREVLRVEQGIPREGRMRGGGPSCRSGRAGLFGVITLGLSESGMRMYIL